MDHTQHFSGLAAQYAAGRPAYAGQFIDCLYNRYGFTPRSVIADIGSGTGKFAKQLLDRGSTVYGVEPNDDMRHRAAAELGVYDKFHSVCGTEAHTTLDSGCVDFVTAAQAFHWFDPLLFRRECQRILRRDGLVFLIWNMQDMSDEVNLATHALYAEYCPRFRGFSCGIQADDPKIQTFFGGAYGYEEFNHPLVYSRAAFLNRSLSSSYTLRDGDLRWDAYTESLNSLFDRWAKDGVLTVANKTAAYIGQLQ